MLSFDGKETKAYDEMVEKNIFLKRRWIICVGHVFFFFCDKNKGLTVQNNV